MPEDHVERCDRPTRRGICLIFEAILGDELRYLPQIGKRQEQKPARLQRANEFRQCEWHFVTLQVLEIVGRPYRIDRTGRDRAHIGDRADDVGLDCRVEIEPDFSPFGPVELPVQPLSQRVAAADIQHGLVGRRRFRDQIRCRQ